MIRRKKSRSKAEKARLLAKFGSPHSWEKDGIYEDSTAIALWVCENCSLKSDGVYPPPKSLQPGCNIYLTHVS